MGAALGFDQPAIDSAVAETSQDELNGVVAGLGSATRSQLGAALEATQEATPETKSFTVVLIRHGESIWNKEKRFTGWCVISAESSHLSLASGRHLIPPPAGRMWP